MNAETHQTVRQQHVSESDEQETEKSVESLPETGTYSPKECAVHEEGRDRSQTQRQKGRPTGER